MTCRLALAVAALACACAAGCTIGRVRRGAPVPVRTDTVLSLGTSTKADVLRELGAPDAVQRQWDGDLFSYRYQAEDLERLDIAWPYGVDVDVFSWYDIDERHDHLLVFFDREGVVRALGVPRARPDESVPAEPAE